MSRMGISILLALGVALSARAASVPSPDHIVIVIEENKSFDDIIGSSKAPYLNSLASRGALFTQFFAAHHPSQPNYVDFFAGAPLGVCDDKCPSAQFAAPNLGAALISAGRSFVGFAEDLPPQAGSVCKVGHFARKHCPWLDFSNIPASASKDFSQFPQDPAGFAALPTVSVVIPNLENDMHNGVSIHHEVKNGDVWLKDNLSRYADWAMTHNSLLIITWDQDSDKHYSIHCPSIIKTSPPKNRIATIVVGQPVATGVTSAVRYTHQNLLRTLLDMYGIAPFGGASTAVPIDDIWRDPLHAAVVAPVPNGPSPTSRLSTAGAGALSTRPASWRGREALRPRSGSVR